MENVVSCGRVYLEFWIGRLNTGSIVLDSIWFLFQLIRSEAKKLKLKKKIVILSKFEWMIPFYFKN